MTHRFTPFFRMGYLDQGQRVWQRVGYCTGLFAMVYRLRRCVAGAEYDPVVKALAPLTIQDRALNALGRKPKPSNKMQLGLHPTHATQVTVPHHAIAERIARHRFAHEQREQYDEESGCKDKYCFGNAVHDHNPLCEPH